MKITTKQLLIACAVLITLASCKNNKIASAKLETKGNLPSMEVQQIELLYSDSAVLKMKLNAPELTDYTTKDTSFTEFKKGLNVLFYSSKSGKGQKDATLKADYGKYDPKREVWEYKGNVSIVGSKNEKLKSNHLFANTKTETLYSEDFVEITLANGSKSSGRNFKSDFSLNNYSFSNASGSIVK